VTDGHRARDGAEPAPALGWEDDILIRVATTRARQATPDVADALLASSTVTVERLRSWWDGFDDYVEDVRVTVAVRPDGSAVLAGQAERLRTVCRDVVDPFVDAHGSWRRGDLVGFVLVDTGTVLDDERVEQRRAALRRALDRSTSD
jgi:hypothetical protein